MHSAGMGTLHEGLAVPRALRVRWGLPGQRRISLVVVASAHAAAICVIDLAIAVVVDAVGTLRIGCFSSVVSVEAALVCRVDVAIAIVVDAVVALDGVRSLGVVVGVQAAGIVTIGLPVPVVVHSVAALGGGSGELRVGVLRWAIRIGGEIRQSVAVVVDSIRAHRIRKLAGIG